MPTWRPLVLSDEPSRVQIPQLLFQARFSRKGYSFLLTDLSNIWSEELGVDEVIDRALQAESPIEVTHHDAEQLTILLGTVECSLVGGDANRHVTKATNDGVVVHTAIDLPGPLGVLHWKFHLQKQTLTTLKNELILPLLVASHIQHERMRDLISTLSEKDRAIARMADHFNSYNLDLAAVFPTIGGAKPSRRPVSRDQAAKHVPGLQVFDEAAWKATSARSVDASTFTVGMFAETLSECDLDVPTALKVDKGGQNWFDVLSSDSPRPENRVKRDASLPVKVRRVPPAPAPGRPLSEDDETEDEFEKHDHFKTRLQTKQSIDNPHRSPPEFGQAPVDLHHSDMIEAEAESSDDADDLDALDSSEKRNRARTQIRLQGPGVQEPQTSKEAQVSARNSSPPSNSKSYPVPRPSGKGFRIGGKARKAASPEPDLEKPPQRAIPFGADDKVFIRAPGKQSKHGFKIGGKTNVNTEAQKSPSGAQTGSPHADPPSRLQVDTEAKSSTEVLTEAVEETAEEKAERKRVELKRKNDELAKKQAHSKKKKRF